MCNMRNSECPQYTAGDFAENCLNRYSRFKYNSRLVAFVVLKTSSYHPANAIQFPLPSHGPMTHAYLSSQFKDATVVPDITHLTNGLYACGVQNGALSIRGKTEYGFPMRSRRSYQIEISHDSFTHSSYTFYPCSPTRNNETDDFDLPIQHFLDTEEVKQRVLENGVNDQKGEITLSRDGIIEREKIMTRNPDQNTVMGESAVNAYRRFYKSYHHILKNDFKIFLESSYKAKLVTKKKTSIGINSRFTH